MNWSETQTLGRSPARPGCAAARLRKDKHMTVIKRFAITCGLSAFSALAQQPAGPPGDHHGPPPGHRPPPSPLMIVLDTNRDGELDATEIASASAALLTLDKNGDGKLTA